MTLRRASGAAVLLGVLLLGSLGSWHALTAGAADKAQEAMADEWAEHVAAPTLAATPTPTPTPTPAAVASPAEPATVAPPAEPAAVALLEVRRPGVGSLLGGPLYVGEGVGADQLARGPGHFPGTALPGQAGNFAVAGHRTTHGGPFADLDGLRAGDEITVTDRAGEQFRYRVVEQRIVHPSATWVAGPDPLGRGRPLLTLTTCHPRYSALQRLVVWAELV